MVRGVRGRVVGWRCRVLVEGGLRTPSPTPSASSSVAGAAEVELAGGMSYDIPVKVPRVGVAESISQKKFAPGFSGLARRA